MKNALQVRTPESSDVSLSRLRFLSTEWKGFPVSHELSKAKLRDAGCGFQESDNVLYAVKRFLLVDEPLSTATIIAITQNPYRRGHRVPDVVRSRAIPLTRMSKIPEIFEKFVSGLR